MDVRIASRTHLACLAFVYREGTQEAPWAALITASVPGESDILERRGGQG